MEDGNNPPPPPPPPPGVTGRTTSLNCSNDSLEFQQTFSKDSEIRESMSTEWTDEKHSLYLKSMEASFVNQLYNNFNSFDLLGRRSQREHSSHPTFPGKKHANACISSGQYKVFRGGCWRKINFEKNEPQLDKGDEGSSVVLANPWIQHYRSTCRQEKAAVGSQSIHVSEEKAAFAENVKQFPLSHSKLCHYDSVGSNTEVTDQNFVDDEDIEGEGASHSPNIAKRMKTSDFTSSSNDQVTLRSI